MYIKKVLIFLLLLAITLTAIWAHSYFFSFLRKEEIKRNEVTGIRVIPVNSIPHGDNIFNRPIEAAELNQNPPELKLSEPQIEALWKLLRRSRKDLSTLKALGQYRLEISLKDKPPVMIIIGNGWIKGAKSGFYRWRHEDFIALFP